MNDEHVTYTGLLDRGWTATMVRDILGEADWEKCNPHYACAAPMRLYDLGRVEAAEKSEVYRAAREKSARRRAGAAKAIETKREALLRKVEAITITVPVMPLERLLSLSLDAWRDHQYDRGRYSVDGGTAPEEVRYRWARNYLRHEMTTYDSHLASIWGRVGTEEAYDLLRDKVEDAIDAAYPELAAWE